MSPVTPMGKDMYEQAGNLKLPWNSELPTFRLKNWIKWLESLPHQIEVPKSIPLLKNSVQSVELNVVRDASKTGVSAAVYAIFKQIEGSCQRIIVSKREFSKKDLSLTRFELVAVHMAAYILENARAALHQYPIKSCYG